MDRNFWKREYKILNDLLEEYPEISFWEKVNFNQSWDSLLILRSDFGKNFLRKNIKNFSINYQQLKK